MDLFLEWGFVVDVFWVLGPFIFLTGMLPAKMLAILRISVFTRSPVYAHSSPWLPRWFKSCASKCKSSSNPPSRTATSAWKRGNAGSWMRL